MTLKPLKLYELRGRIVAIRSIDRKDASENNTPCVRCGKRAKRVIFEWAPHSRYYASGCCGNLHCEAIVQEDGEG